MSRDETRYPNAEQFLPERFLDAEGMLTDDTPDFAFGFGRRVCPGKPDVDLHPYGYRELILIRSTHRLCISLDHNGDDVSDARFQPRQGWRWKRRRV